MAWELAVGAVGLLGGALATAIALIRLERERRRGDAAENARELFRDRAGSLAEELAGERLKFQDALERTEAAFIAQRLHLAEVEKERDEVVTLLGPAAAGRRLASVLEGGGKPPAGPAAGGPGDALPPAAAARVVPRPRRPGGK